MLLALMSLLCCVCVAKSCLQCDSKVRRLNEDFILSAPTVATQNEIRLICDHTYVTYSNTTLGVIDPTTLYRARTEYESEFHRFLRTNRDGSLTMKAIRIMQGGKRILDTHLNNLIRDGLCPNMCGLLNRRVINCVSCRYEIYVCPSPSGQQDCGDYPVQAEERGQAVLNCFLPWHRLLLGRPEYHYHWAPGLPGTETLNESVFRPLVVTGDSSLILNQLHVDEQGTYRCTLQDNGTIFYQIMFLLTVTPLPNQTHRPLLTLPTPPSGDTYSPFQHTEGWLVPVIAMVTALSLAASVGLTIILGIWINQQAAEETRRRSHSQE